ncbi:MAG TPA: ATP-binding protein [Methylomirabilota bacterium]|nr:ATP-binding protein [Methylomirabilota bacterium]
MPGELNCIFTKGLIPFIEKEVGPEGVAAILRTAARSRDWLMADHNWIPLSLANELVRLSMELMGEADEERWARRFGEHFMDWKPSREERSYLGTYTMGIGSPRGLYERTTAIYSESSLQNRFFTLETLRLGPRSATFRWTPRLGYRIPRWLCTWLKVQFERFPTNWGLPRARITESQCAAQGADSCLWEARWKNPSLGYHFWAPAASGAVASGLMSIWFVAIGSFPWPTAAATVLAPVLVGGALGYGLLQRYRRHHTQRLLDLQSEEIIYSNLELEKKFADLETKIEQLSLLMDLSAAVNATLEPEKIYEQALQRLVHRMGYQAAYLSLVDWEHQQIRGHKMAGGSRGVGPQFEGIELPLDAGQSLTAKVAITGLPVLVNDVESTDEPVHLPLSRALKVRSLVAVPLRVKERIFGVLVVVSDNVNHFTEADTELVSSVGNHVALAVDKAESFQTIEGLSRGLEEKVRVRTEQLRAANEELQAAYRELQATQMQLIQREKMASVGQLVAGVAHELNNPIGFVFSNVTTLEDFVRRLRAMLEAYRVVPLPESEQARVQEQWEALKVDYALKYLDSMTEGIREGAERARKIVKDLRVFARGQDEVWQTVDLHEEIESSLTLLNHLLKDRVTVNRKFGELPSVECIRSQIDQVFLNLLANAAQAITGPGAITIETRVENGFAVAQVRDTGPGIAAEIIGRIFDPFFTTKPVGEGSGLGLSISYEIVKKHGGEIRAESRPGEGAEFTLRIPLARATQS